MQNGKTITCFIPAKGSSDRLPGKNILPCNGVPLVRRAVELAHGCGVFDEIVLSTESRQVLEASSSNRGEGALWHPRPEDLCGPRSSVWDAVKHYYRLPLFDYVMLLHPTSPCLKTETIKDALNSMIENEGQFEALVSTSRSSPFSWGSGEHPPKFYTVKGTQFHIPRFQLNNAIFIAKLDRLLEVKNGYELKWMPYMIPVDEAVDIDDETDFEIAEAILQWRQNHEEAAKPATENL